MTLSAAGIFTKVIVPGRPGTFVKILNDGSQYVELVSLMFAVHQNFGSCMAQ